MNQNVFRLRLLRKGSDLRMQGGPEFGQGGRRGAVRLAVERLEPRTMLAGDLEPVVTNPPLDLPFCPAEGSPCLVPYALLDGTAVSIVLQITKPDGTPVDSVSVGDDVVLHVLTQDLRQDPHGVFAAFLDVRWDAALAAVSGPIAFGDTYPNGHQSNIGGTGLIDEAGAFSGGTEVGAGLHELFTVPLHATAVGELTLAADPADVRPITDVLVYGINDPIDPLDVNYGSVSLSITDVVASPTADPPPVGDAPAGDPPTGDAPLTDPTADDGGATGSEATSTTSDDATLQLAASGTAGGATTDAALAKAMLLSTPAAVAGDDDVPTLAAAITGDDGGDSSHSANSDATIEAVADAATAQTDLTLL
jgi:hypothetical protein